MRIKQFFDYLCPAIMKKMTRIIYILFLLILLLPASKSWAQKAGFDYEGPGSFFFGVDFGASLSMNENIRYADAFKTEIPSAGVQFGYAFTPLWSARLSGLFSSQLGHPSAIVIKYNPTLYKTYGYNAFVVDADVMLNLTNCFRPYNSRNVLDFYAILGVGSLYTFGFDKFIDDWDKELFAASSESLTLWNAKAGFNFAWHMTRAYDLQAEIDVFATDNKFNGIQGLNRPFDWFTSMRIGVVYYFHNGMNRQRFANPRKPHFYWKELD